MKFLNNTMAAFFMIASSFFYSLQYLDIKLLSPHYDLWTLIFSRGCSSLFIALFYLLITQKRNVLGTARRKLLARGLLGGMTTISSFYTMRHLDISTATMILSLTPIMSAILSIQRGMPWKITDTISVLLSFSGILMLMITIRDHSEGTMLGILSAIVTTMLHACVNITIRDVKDENAVVISMYSMICCILMSLPGVLVSKQQWKLNNAWILVELLGMGMITIAAQSLKTLAIQYSDGMGVLIFRYMDILFCVVWDMSLFHHRVHIYEIMSFSLIAGGCAIQIYA